MTKKKTTNRKPAKKKTTAASSASAPERPKHGFPVVGIGASAGGLEALDELLQNMPADTGMAFVVLTHQHPGHTSLLPELLGKETEMPVVEAADGTTLEPNHVYVGPPGGHLATLNGTLHRMETDEENSPRLPIDYRRTRNSSPPTKSCSQPTRRCRVRTRSWKHQRKSCSR